MTDHLDELTRDELRDVAKAAGLAVSGTKADLVARIRDTAPPTGDETGPAGEPETAELAASAPDIHETAPEAPPVRKPRGPGLRRNQNRRIRLGHR